MREKWRHDRETCFRKNVGFLTFILHLKCVFANILFISFIFNIKFMFCISFIIINDLIFIYLLILDLFIFALKSVNDI